MKKDILKSSILVVGYILAALAINALFDDNEFGGESLINYFFKVLVEFLVCVVIGGALAINSFKTKKWEKKNWWNVAFIVLLVVFSAVIILEPLMVVAFGTRVYKALEFLRTSNILVILGILTGFHLGRLIFEQKLNNDN